MAAIDRTQTNASRLVKLHGHRIAHRWQRFGLYLRKNTCLDCGQTFEVVGFVSAYGISARSTDNVLDQCTGKQAAA